MYPSVRDPALRSAETPEQSGGSRIRPKVLSQNLVALGLTSFFSDVSSEMMLAVVPLFLTTTLGFSILGFGLFEAAYQGMNALFRVVGGSLADRRQRHKQTAAAGYAISAATRFGLVASSLVAGIPAVPFLLADRVGKGIRTAPRDALISLSTHPARLATAFGVHRTLDTAGALLGPLLAFIVLAQAPGAFDAVFVISAIAAVVGVAIISVFAQERTSERERMRSASGLRVHWATVLRTPGVRPLMLAAGLLSTFTISDAFIYLLIQRTTDMSARFFPLLFAGTAVVYLLLAVPFGRLADRIGAAKVYVAGHVLLIGVYLVVAWSGLGLLASLTTLGLLGAYYAATDGVVAAITSQLVPTEIRASGIALVTVIVAVGRMASAGFFGAIWHSVGRGQALGLWMGGLVFALIVGATLIRSRDLAQVPA